MDYRLNVLRRTRIIAIGIHRAIQFLDNPPKSGSIGIVNSSETCLDWDPSLGENSSDIGAILDVDFGLLRGVPPASGVCVATRGATWRSAFGMNSRAELVVNSCIQYDDLRLDDYAYNSQQPQSQQAPNPAMESAPIMIPNRLENSTGAYERHLPVSLLSLVLRRKLVGVGGRNTHG